MIDLGYGDDVIIGTGTRKDLEDRSDAVDRYFGTIAPGTVKLSAVDIEDKIDKRYMDEFVSREST